MKVPTQLKYGSGIAKIAITKCKYWKIIYKTRVSCEHNDRCVVCNSTVK